MRNVSAPINKLPPEILAYVCTFTPEIISDFAHLCAQVCRYWRNVLLESPLLWNEIYVGDSLHVEVHLARSGEAPLDLYIDGEPRVGRLLGKVIPHLGRVRLLYLFLRAGDDRILDRLVEPEMTLLRDLRFERTSSALRLSASIMAKISSLGVNTTKLLLCNTDTHLSSLKFPHLRCFCLITEAGFEKPHISDMIDFLRGHPMLEELKLDRVNHFRTDDAGTNIEPTSLQHLKVARLGGWPSSTSSDSLPYLEVDLLPYLRLPSTGQCSINISSPDVTLPRRTNYLLTLIHAWEIISSHGGDFSGGFEFARVELSVEESPRAFTGQLELWIAGWGSLCVGPEEMAASNLPWLPPDWETTNTDKDPGAGEAGDDEFKAQLLRLGRYLDPLRRYPSPLVTVETLVLRGFGYTRNKGKYLQYLRKCFKGLNRVREFQADKTNPWMVVHLLQPFEGRSGGMVLLFPLLQLLTFSNCTPVELPRSEFLEMTKKRAELGTTMKEARVDNEEVDLSELSGVQDRT